jgi:hypothetical protein
MTSEIERDNGYASGTYERTYKKLSRPKVKNDDTQISYQAKDIFAKDTKSDSNISGIISAELLLKMGNICSSCCEKGKYTAIGVNESENFHNDPGAQFNAMLGLVFVI